MQDILALLAEQRIGEAMKEGQFDNLPGKGKPLPPEPAALVPAEQRAGYKLLKNAGLLPVEMDLKKELTILEQALGQADRPAEKRRLLTKLADTTLRYNMLMEKRKKR